LPEFTFPDDPFAEDAPLPQPFALESGQLYFGYRNFHVRRGDGTELTGHGEVITTVIDGDKTDSKAFEGEGRILKRSNK